ncbi:hypothetical protein PSYPI_35745 [Pseudomonas syringae pv. pisi str. 1704B]|uniref:Uncharacterized protein n=1 Tax=Pseudomonas syringae pv. pisi str. 1704B TaxID=629263 RepID=F3GJT1_PSESJ|nr:hypothetical protein PSYPI_35745 [Pseudomonas syringae pv. pisi str. 1704B]
MCPGKIQAAVAVLEGVGAASTGLSACAGQLLVLFGDR